MASIFDTQSIDIPCKCGKKHKRTIGWIKTNSHIKCDCGTDITLDKSEFVRKLNEVDRALDSIPRKINIKF